MEEKVDFYTDSIFLESLVQGRFKRNYSLEKEELLYFLDDLEQNLDKTSYRVLERRSNFQRNFKNPVVRERFANGLVRDNNHDSNTYTKNGTSFRLVG